jgi:hypothetical protein
MAKRHVCRPCPHDHIKDISCVFADDFILNYSDQHGFLIEPKSIYRMLRMFGLKEQAVRFMDAVAAEESRIVKEKTIKAREEAKKK